MTFDPFESAGAFPGTDPALEAGCTSFEATLNLLEGELVGAARAAAAAHAGGCAVCGPMVAGWAPLGAALRERLEQAAEGAKPELAAVTDRVMAQLFAAPAPKRGFGAAALSWLKRLQAPLALGAAAAAIAVVFVPMLRPDDAPVLPPPSDDPAGTVVRRVSFEGADGYVFRAESDGTPVIWIQERDGV